MIDEDFRTWLIEVNTNPYLGIPNDYIKLILLIYNSLRDLLPKMMDDLFELTIDAAFPPKVPIISNITSL